MSKMTSVKLTVIDGGRDALEASLVIALFKADVAEIDRISEKLNAIQKNHRSKLELVKSAVSKSSKP